MSHHKRKRPKKQRAGCLFCKPHKGNGAGREKDPPKERRKMQREEGQEG